MTSAFFPDFDPPPMLAIFQCYLSAIFWPVTPLPSNYWRRLWTAPSIFWKNIFMQLQSVPIPTPTRYYSHFDTVSTLLWSDFLQNKIVKISLKRLLVLHCQTRLFEWNTEQCRVHCKYLQSWHMFYLSPFSHCTLTSLLT